MGGGGKQMKFYPYKNVCVCGGGGGGVLAMLKGGHKQFWGSFSTGA